MQNKLRWVTSVSASALHAAAAERHGPEGLLTAPGGLGLERTVVRAGG